MKRLLFCYGWFHTLDCFTLELVKAAKKMGRECLAVDICTPGAIEKISDYIKQGNTAVMMFNNCGLTIEKDGQNVWDSYDIPVYDLLVEHPRSFPVLYEYPVKNLSLGVVDREHIEFVKKYLSVSSCFFYQQGGTTRVESGISLENQKKEIDILIIGACQPENHFPVISELPDDGEQFFVSVIEKMLENPAISTDSVVEDYLENNDFGFNDDEKRAFIFENAFIPEVFVRRYYKHSILKSLSKEKFNVEIYGENWKIPDFSLSDTIHIHEKVSPEACFPLIEKSKIVLNFMPWFKDGSHPRVYDSQLNGAVCFSDKSKFLEETQADGKTLVFFDYLKRGEMIRKLREVLNNDGLRKYIVEKAYENACGRDTWEAVFNDIVGRINI